MRRDVYPGKDLGTPADGHRREVQHYVKGLDERTPVHDASPFGGPVAPVDRYQQGTASSRWYLDNLFGNRGGAEWEDTCAEPRGQSCACRARGRSLPEARSRRRRAGDVGAGRGGMDRAQRPSQSFMADRPRRGDPCAIGEQERRAGKGTSLRGSAVGRAPNEHSPTRRAGSSLYAAGTITLTRRPRKSSAWRHGDGGRMTLSCVTELRTGTSAAASTWACRLGREVHQVLWPTEPFTTRGNHHGPSRGGGQTRATVTVFCEKNDGTEDHRARRVLLRLLTGATHGKAYQV